MGCADGRGTRGPMGLEPRLKLRPGPAWSMLNTHDAAHRIVMLLTRAFEEGVD